MCETFFFFWNFFISVADAWVPIVTVIRILYSEVLLLSVDVLAMFRSSCTCPWASSSIPLGVPVRESQGEGSIVVALPQSAVPWADRIADIVCWGGLETQGIGQVTQ